MTLQEALTDKYLVYADSLAKRFREANGVDMDWANISRPTLARFAEHLQTIVARSTTRHYFAIVKATLSLYDDIFELPHGWQSALRV